MLMIETPAPATLADAIPAHVATLRTLAARFDAAGDFGAGSALMGSAAALVAAAAPLAAVCDPDTAGALAELRAELAGDGDRPCTCETYGWCAPCRAGVPHHVRGGDRR